MWILIEFPSGCRFTLLRHDAAPFGFPTRFLESLFIVFEASWGAFGVSRGSLGGLLESLGAILGRLGAKLGGLGATFGVSWGDLGAS